MGAGCCCSGSSCSAPGGKGKAEQLPAARGVRGVGFRQRARGKKGGCTLPGWLLAQKRVSLKKGTFTGFIHLRDRACGWVSCNGKRWDSRPSLPKGELEPHQG